MPAQVSTARAFLLLRMGSLAILCLAPHTALPRRQKRDSRRSWKLLRLLEQTNLRSEAHGKRAPKPRGNAGVSDEWRQRHSGEVVANFTPSLFLLSSPCPAASLPTNACCVPQSSRDVGPAPHTRALRACWRLLPGGSDMLPRPRWLSACIHSHGAGTCDTSTMRAARVESRIQQAWQDYNKHSCGKRTDSSFLPGGQCLQRGTGTCA